MRKRYSGGFTLIELTVVVMILGILAAVAIPRYFSLVKQTRIATLNGLAGTLRSTIILSRTAYQAAGDPTADTVTLGDGTTTIQVSTGTSLTAGTPISIAPTVAGAGNISSAIDTQGTFTYTAGTPGTFKFATDVSGCNVTYDGTTGAVMVVPGGC